MALSCGCEMRGGMPVSKEMAQTHFKHTQEAIFLWELMVRPGEDRASEARQKLVRARIDLLDAIEELYPEAKEEP